MRKSLLLMLVLLCLSLIGNVVFVIFLVKAEGRAEKLSAQKEHCEKKYEIIGLILAWLTAEVKFRGSIDEDLVHRGIRLTYDRANEIEAEDERKKFLYELYQMTSNRGESYKEWDERIQEIPAMIWEQPFPVIRDE